MVELRANTVIRPDGPGLFDCTVNGIDIQWTVNGNVLNIQGSRPVGFFAENPNVPNAVAILIITRDVVNPNLELVNRTSVLRLVPEPDAVGPIAVTCGGSGVGQCTVNVSISGECLY